MNQDQSDASNFSVCGIEERPNGDGGVQGSIWVKELMRKDSDGDEAFEFVVVDTQCSCPNCQARNSRKNFCGIEERPNGDGGEQGTNWVKQLMRADSDGDEAFDFLVEDQKAPCCALKHKAAAMTSTMPKSVHA
jgi:hypothetical protein